jgi:hypothetical protein
VKPEAGPQDFRKHNVSGVPRSRFLHNWTTTGGRVKRLGKLLLPKRTRSFIKDKIRETNLVKRSINPELRQELTLLYKDDITKLQQLLNRDLSHWLQ